MLKWYQFIYQLEQIKSNYVSSNKHMSMLRSKDRQDTIKHRKLCLQQLFVLIIAVKNSILNTIGTIWRTRNENFPFILLKIRNFRL